MPKPPNLMVAPITPKRSRKRNNPPCRERVAYERGYRVHPNGEITSPWGRKITGSTRNGGYVYLNTMGIAGHVSVHRLVAFQKYGDSLYAPGIEVRHLNGNPSDYSESNIALGTKSQNAMDKTPETRLRTAINATRYVQKWNHEAIFERYQAGASYKRIMVEFGITSKGTVSFIINRSMTARTPCPALSTEQAA